MNKAILCSRCILPMKEEETSVASGRQCALCDRYDKKWKGHDWQASRLEFKRSIEESRNRGNGYDCIVPVSGGKDSSYVLYVLRKQYGLRTLAVHYDNWFQSPEAHDNVRSLVRRLGTGLISHCHAWEPLKELYKTYTVRTGGDICATCNMGVSHAVYKIAEAENIPLIIWGYSPVLENTPIYSGKRYCREKMYRNVLMGTGAESLAGLLAYDHFKRRNHFKSLYFFAYHEYSESRIKEVLKKELAWKEASHGSNKADCAIFPVANYFKILANGYGRLRIKKAALVRDGQIIRKEAMEEIEKREGTIPPPELREVLGKIGLAEEDFQNSERKNRLDYVEHIPLEEAFKGLEKSGLDLVPRAKRLIDIIRIEVERDGGTIEMVKIDKGFLHFRLGGDCRGCFLQQVMVNYIDTLMLRFLPELKGSLNVV
jgi:tRNA(Ile)-lysidine synthase TilS/MesJ